MAELTTLEAKLGEVTGLAMAAQDLTKKVSRLVKEEGEHSELVGTLKRMGQEAAETQRRCTQLAAGLDGKKTAILTKARETKQEAAEMAGTYLGDDADALDGFEFMTMAEAGEVGHWGVVAELAKKARQRDLQELARWAQPIQKQHFDLTLRGSLGLARSQDPNETE
ncbi:MAG: hypothetical protein ACXWZP_10355 [Gaiellaceae bacterium]